MDCDDSYALIATPERLSVVCRGLRRHDWLALDTEFIRESTYFPRLCLIQVATPDEVWCIDPLALPDLQPLLDVLYDPRIVKVFHAARQDLEIFYHLRGELPRPVFDTQLAALLLGHPDQVGYAALVSEVLGVTLDKAHSRTDWAKRPLPPAQLHYAADDVRYLAALYPRLRDDLVARGRLNWLDDDFARLTDPATYRTDAADAWQRVRGADRLRPKALAILQALAAWRETTAINEDRPRGWVLHDEVMIDLARLAPDTMTALESLRGLRRDAAQRYGAAVLAIIRDARTRAATPPAASTRLSPDQQALADVLMAIVRLRGTQESLNPATLASRKDIEHLVAGERDSRVLQGWRKGLVGDDLMAFLDGERRLVCGDGGLQIEVR